MRHILRGSTISRAALGIGLLVAGSSQAMLIRNLATNQVLFSDDYEGVTATPSSSPDLTGTFNPVTLVGSWTLNEDFGHEIQVTSGANPGPAQGSNYLRVYRDSTAQSNELDGYLTGVQGDAHIGEVIRLETMVYIPVGSPNARFQLMLQAAPGNVSTSEAWVRPNGAGHVSLVAPGFDVVDTGVPYLEGVWQKWTIDYAVNASTFSLSVDNNTATGLTSFYSSGVTGFQLVNGSNTPGSAYFDAVPVPEPVSLGFCAIAMPLLRRRRNR